MQISNDLNSLRNNPILSKMKKKQNHKEDSEGNDGCANLLQGISSEESLSMQEIVKAFNHHEVQFF